MFTVCITVLCVWLSSYYVWITKERLNFFYSGILIFYMILGCFSTFVIALVTHIAYHYNTPRLKDKTLSDSVT